MKHNIYENLTKESCLNLLSRHGFRKQDVRLIMGQIEQLDHLWFQLENLLYRFTITYTKNKPKKWSVTYVPFFVKPNATEKENAYKAAGYRERYAMEYGKMFIVNLNEHKCQRFIYSEDEPYQDANGATFDTVSKTWVN